MNRICCVAVCNENQWALDFDGNLERVIASIREAKAKGARLRVGPELELCGYSCEDHFLELDLYRHCNESLCRLLSSDVTCDILCDIGCPFLFNGVRYNCKVYCLDKKIVFIRPKMALAEDGNYRENRYFTSWKSVDHCASFVLPPEIQEVTSQREVPFGFAFIKASDSSIGCEICEELWAPSNPHQMQFLHGIDIICNGSGSHHRLRKLDNRIKLIQSATSKCGGAYLYSNLRGCDGGRLYFDGSSMINVNGKWLSQASQFSFVDVEVITALIDLNEITAFRQGSGILQLQSSIYQSSISPVSAVPSIEIKFSLCSSRWNRSPLLPPTHLPHLFSPEEECIFGPSCWLWDYLRRSKADGFLLPLSGGADSAAVASIVYVMCCRAIDEASRGNTQVQEDLKRWIKNDNHAEVINSGSLLLIDAENKKESNDSFLNKHYLGWSPLNLCHEILHTVYLGSDNSSTSTNQRASQLSKEIGSYHCNLPIESVVQVCLTTFSVLTGGKKPRYECQGGTKVEDLALQNLQARIRMVLSYLCAQLFPWIRNPSSPGFLLVLGAANVDEALRGYMTKYDCSSADLNPIGGISKKDLRSMLRWASSRFSLPSLISIVDAPPSAELKPLSSIGADNYTQTDEDEMGMTYDELSVFGVLRKIQRCGPVDMFLKLLRIWNHLSISEIVVKVKRFFYFYSVNRHKMTTLTPSYHAEDYSPDDNRFDLRPFLYNTKWSRQFAVMDEVAKQMTSSEQ